MRSEHEHEARAERSRVAGNLAEVKPPISLSLLLTATLIAPAAAQAADPIRRGGDGIESLTQPHPATTASTPAFGLSKFSVKTPKPRGLAKLGALLGLGHVTGWFTGAFELDIMHEQLPTGEVKTASRQRCNRSCDVAIEAPGKGEVLVLSGFLFQTRDGFARSVSSVWVRPDPDERVVNVGLIGAQGFEFDAMIQYAYVPASRIVGGRVYEGQKQSEGGGKRVRLNFPALAGDHGRTMFHSFHLGAPGARNFGKVSMFAVRESAVLVFDDSELSGFKARAGIVRLTK